MIAVSPKELEMILGILREHAPGSEVRAFGSRYKKTNTDRSDLDLAIVGQSKLSLATLGALRDAFEESDLPYRVDVLDYHAVSDEFREVIDAGYETVYKPDNSLPHEWIETTLGEACRSSDIVNHKPAMEKAEREHAKHLGKTEDNPSPAERPYLESIRRVQKKLEWENHHGEENKKAMNYSLPEDWKATNWGEIANLFYGKSLRDHSPSDFSSIPVFGTNGQIGYTDKTICNNEGVIVGRKGAYRGIHYSKSPFWVIDTAFYLQPKLSGIFDMKWAYYQLLTQNINAMDSGSAIPSTSKTDFNALNVLLPPLPEQHAIAATLSCLDDKIELNNSMNKTLEEIAQAIFKRWFIDFEFPDENGNPYKSSGGEMVESELGLIPKGWRDQAVESFANKVAMGPFGSNIKVETFVRNGVPIISGNHLRGLLLSEQSYNFITEEHANKLSNSIVSAGDIVFTHAGNIGQVAMIPYDCEYSRYIISQRQFYLRCDRNKVLPEYINYFFHTREGQAKLLANASQTGVPSIARPSSHLKKIIVLVPPLNIQTVWLQIIKPMLNSLTKKSKENKCLFTLRDTLLPKLMNGERRIQMKEEI